MTLFDLSKSIIIDQISFLFVILTFTIPVITLQILSISIFICGPRIGSKINCSVLSDAQHATHIYDDTNGHS